jgi:MFS family permease
MLGNRNALIVLLVSVFINIAGFSLILPLLPFYGKELGASPIAVALLFSAYSFGNIFGEIYWGRLSDKVGRKRVMIGCLTSLLLMHQRSLPRSSSALSAGFSVEHWASRKVISRTLPRLKNAHRIWDISAQHLISALPLARLLAGCWRYRMPDWPDFGHLFLPPGGLPPPPLFGPPLR